MQFRSWISVIFFSLLDHTPQRLKWRLAKTPFIHVYRRASSLLGNALKEGYYKIQLGPLQGKLLYIGPGDSRGYSTARDYLAGIYEPVVTSTILQYCKPGSKVCDIGAHYGYFAMMMAQNVGESGQCIAFEPSNDNYQKIQKSIEINKLTNICIEQYAVSDHDGTVRFILHDNSFMGHINDDESFQTNTAQIKSEEVKTCTLDTYCTDKDLHPISFIKIDVEGAEKRVLDGATMTIQNDLPVLLIEIHTFMDLETNARPIIIQLNERGYKVYHLGTDILVDPLIFTGGHVLAVPNNTPD